MSFRSPTTCLFFFYKYFLFVSFGGTRFFSLELVGCSPRLFSQPFNCLPFLFFAFLGSHPHPLWSIVVNEPLAHHHHHHYHHGRRYYERNHFFFDFFSFCRNRTVDETDLPISAASDATEQKNKRNIQENPRKLGKSGENLGRANCDVKESNKATTTTTSSTTTTTTTGAFSHCDVTGVQLGRTETHRNSVKTR